MRVLYIPLDERPCNLLYPFNYVANNENIELVTLPDNLLGYKKSAPSIDLIWAYIFDNIADFDTLVCSFDTLLYGSLLNSRLHHFDENKINEHIENIKKIKSINPRIKIYGFSLIMRTPRYNSSDEEPSYYEEYGYNIFKKKYLEDKKVKIGLDQSEQLELDNIYIPSEHLVDYESRRDININATGEILNLFESNIIDFFTIPQDDSCEYGYTALDQKKIFSKHNNVLSYSGADEAGVELLARAYKDYYEKSFKVFIDYSNNNNGKFIPMYEDRNVDVNLKSHLDVVNGEVVNDFDDCEYVIAYNITNSEIMCESFDQFDNENLKLHEQSLTSFVGRLVNYINEGKKVICVDSAFANGGDLSLIKELTVQNILDKIYVYKGWNTNCNSLGSALANALLNSGEQSRLNNLALSYYEDVVYQAVVRKSVNFKLNVFDCNYFDISSNTSLIENLIKQECDQVYNYLISPSSLRFEFNVWSPWKRMFEIGVKIEQ